MPIPEAPMTSIHRIALDSSLVFGDLLAPSTAPASVLSVGVASIPLRAPSTAGTGVVVVVVVVTTVVVVSLTT